MRTGVYTILLTLPPHRTMPSLNAAQAPLHLVPIFQPGRRNGFRQALQSVLHPARKAFADCFLLFLTALRAAQDIGLLALRNRHLLDFHFRSYLRPILLE